MIIIKGKQVSHFIIIRMSTKYILCVYLKYMIAWNKISSWIPIYLNVVTLYMIFIYTWVFSQIYWHAIKVIDKAIIKKLYFQPTNDPKNIKLVIYVT